MGIAFIVAALLLAGVFWRQDKRFVLVLVTLCLIAGSLFEVREPSAHWGWSLVLIFSIATLVAAVVCLTVKENK